jgi:glycogen operon protein
VKNFLAILMLSAGTPMLLMGDEVRRTQHGNNNAYCQDNEISWFDWTLLERHADLHRFVKELNAFRQGRDIVGSGISVTLNELLHRVKLDWHGVRLGAPDWGASSHSLAFTLQSLSDRFLLHGMFNAYWEPLTFELPPASAGQQRWRRCIDTALPSPDDICRWKDAPVVEAPVYLVQPRSVAMLVMSRKGAR